MSYIVYRCSNDHTWDYDSSLGGESQDTCPECGERYYRSSYRSKRPESRGKKCRVNAFVFKGYVEEGAGPRSLHFQNREDRDTFLRENPHMTYDKKSDVKKPEGFAVDDLTLEEVKAAARKNGDA